jgi:tyrosine-protein phosphatase SIW14
MDASKNSASLTGAHPADQMDLATAQYEQIVAYLRDLELPTSEQLKLHAASTTHEDLPHDHECNFKCMLESRGTATPPASVRSRSAKERFHSFVPPANYGAVLPGLIYRSSYPKPENYEFIQDLKIKSILTLVPETLPAEYQTFMKGSGIQHFQVHIRSNKDGQVRVESCEMSRALRLIMDRTNHPILIHCNKGKHRTGCTVACFKRIIGYELDDIVNDYHIYAGAKARFLDEVFFESFDLNNVMWSARQEGWVAPEIDIPPPSPPISPAISLVAAKTCA